MQEVQAWRLIWGGDDAELVEQLRRLAIEVVAAGKKV
jgi:hypothetical protein